jgi:hypothetical protein
MSERKNNISFGLPLAMSTSKRRIKEKKFYRTKRQYEIHWGFLFFLFFSFISPEKECVVVQERTSFEK